MKKLATVLVALFAFTSFAFANDEAPKSEEHHEETKMETTPHKGKKKKAKKEHKEEHKTTEEHTSGEAH